ncbi:Amy4N [Symbiodinium natans]|uniref:Amy4N protein n=1 Tax=Symbiodinium natans TaxID=878477 RepID=A0A812PF10_9DINO|nr:Amy4N [Symbiodinium natans]
MCILCQPMRGASRQLTTVSCPTRSSLHTEWGCPDGELGPELLVDPGFSGAAWGTYLKEPGGASFSFTGNGVAVDAAADDDETPWHVQLTQAISLEQGGATESFYSLCVQASSTEAGTIQFAVDADGALNFAVAGGDVRLTMFLWAYLGISQTHGPGDDSLDCLHETGTRLAGDGRFRNHCFGFRLGPSDFTYQGRVSLDLGAVKDVKVCHASLKRCAVRPRVAGITPVRRCHLAPLSQGLGCTLLDSQSGAEFRENRHGQATCLQISGELVRKPPESEHACESSDEFRLQGSAVKELRFLLGRSPDKVQRLQPWNSLALTLSSISMYFLYLLSGKEVFSELCEYNETVAGRRGAEKRPDVTSRQCTSYVQLWEWNFDDIAKEEASAQCLPDAVPPSLRKLLQSDAARFPLGIWVNGNPQDLIMSAIFETRSQEVLGINTSVSQQRRRSVADGFYALAGCEANEPQWNCHGAESRMHVMLGAFVVYSEAQLDQVQRLRVGGILERALFDQAYREHTASLDFFRTYAAEAADSVGSFRNVFARIGDFDPADLSCHCHASSHVGSVQC